MPKPRWLDSTNSVSDEPGSSHFWIDSDRGIAAAVLMQMLPTNDPEVVALLTAFERAVYERVR